MICPKHGCELTPMIYSSFCGECEKEQVVTPARVTDLIRECDRKWHHPFNQHTHATPYNGPNLAPLPTISNKLWMYEADVVNSPKPSPILAKDYPPSVRPYLKHYVHNMFHIGMLPNGPRNLIQALLVDDLYFRDFNFRIAYSTRVKFDAMNFTVNVAPQYQFYALLDYDI